MAYSDKDWIASEDFTYSWYASTDGSWGNASPIGQTGENIKVLSSFNDKFIAVKLTPKSEETLPETSLRSAFLAPNSTAVADLEGLKNIRNSFGSNVSSGAIYSLMRDLDFADSTSYRYISNMDIWSKNSDSSNSGWEPIGTTSQCFEGRFYGNGFTISNLYINRPESDNLGLFRFYGESGAIISDLTLTDVSIKGRSGIGGIASVSSGEVVNCHVSGMISTNSGTVGGIVGSNLGSIKNCSSTLRITSSGGKTGGISGDNHYLDTTYAAIIVNSYSAGTISGTSYIGGITGHTDSGSKIYNCYSDAIISGNSFAGGIVGYNKGGAVEYTYSSGDVHAVTTAGGITGFNSGTVRYNFALNTVSRSSGTDTSFGRIVGDNQNSVDVTSNSSIGVIRSFDTGVVNGDSISTDYAKNDLIYINWEFGRDSDNPWVMPKDSYPKFYWQYPDGVVSSAPIIEEIMDISVGDDSIIFLNVNVGDIIKIYDNSIAGNLVSMSTCTTKNMVNIESGLPSLTTIYVTVTKPWGLESGITAYNLYQY